MDHSFFIHYSLMDIWVVPTFFFFSLNFFIWSCQIFLGHMGYLLHHVGSSTVAHRLSGCGVWAQLPCRMGDLSSLTRGWTRVPCIAGQILSPWTTSEIPRFHLLTAVNCAAMNKRVPVFVFSSFGYLHSNGIAGPFGNSMFSFLRNYQTIPTRGWIISPSHQQFTRVPVSPHPP